MDQNRKFSRRALLRAVVLLGGATLTTAFAPEKDVLAQQKATKQAMKYQDKPNGDQKCSNCMHFLPNNMCAIVEGTVSPDGYCIAWAKKA